MTYLQLCQRIHTLLGMGSRGNTAKPGAVPTTTVGQVDELAEIVEWASMAWLNFQNSQRWGWLIQPGTLAFATGVDEVVPTLTLTNYRDVEPFVEAAGDPRRRYVLSYPTADGPSAGEQKCYYEPPDVFLGFRDRAPMATGRPLVFTVHPDQTWQVWPTPDAGYTLRFQYLYKAKKLAAASDEAVLLEDHPATGRGLPDDLQDVVVWTAIRYWAETRGNITMLQLAEKRHRELLKPIKERYLPGVRLGYA